MKNKKTLFFIIFGLIVVPISAVIATIELRMQTAWPRSPIPGGIGLNSTSTITNLIQYLYEWGIALGGLITFVALLIAGFLYLTSVGDPTKMKEAIDRIKAAFLGLALLLSSYLILHTINPDLTTLRPIDFNITNIPPVQLPDIEGMFQVKSCVNILAFEKANFINHVHTFIPGDQKEPDPIPMSYVMCREIICRPTRDNEVPTVNLCPGGGKIATETPRTDDLCRRHSGKENLVEGGACTLQLASAGWLFGWGCGKPIVEVSGPRISDLATILATGGKGDDKVKCIELIARGQ